MINVAYIYTTPHFSGAAVSLAEVLKSLAGTVRPIILTPRGSALDFFARQLGECVHGAAWLSQFDHTRHGRYRGARWLVALREAVLLPVTWFEVRRFAPEARDAQLIHLNEITGIVPAILLKRRLNVPLVVHVRAHMGEQSRGLRSRLLWRMVGRHVDQLVCIDETVQSTVAPGLPCPVHVIHNALSIATEAVPQPNPDGPAALLGPGQGIRIGIVGSLLRVKGVYEFLDAAIGLCRKRDDLVFAFVGSGVRRLAGPRGWLLSRLGLAEDTEQGLRTAIAQAGLQHRIVMAGHREDIHAIYRELDVLCFPSHYNAPGRPIFEAAYFGKPSIAAIEDPRPDTLVDGLTGLVVPAKDSEALARAIEWLADHPAQRHAMGAAAKDLAERNFNLETNAREVLRLYRLLATPPRTADPADPADPRAAVGQVARP